ncbi:MAG: RagB/SusD family nutrient uptake outer membrane protein [Tannerellaceae bacterium]|jgi:hypothetical protein|nr:RagB/SusD family nutrient uptake outer membrane protein [Tannerellaceae bacterium]
MKPKHIKAILLFTIIIAAATSCTNLDENVYDKITSETFYQTKENVYQGFVRPFEHAYWACAGASFQVAENSSDHFMTPNRQGHWLDGQNYFRLHWHQWTIDDWIPRDAWLNNFQGIVYCNSAIGDLSSLTPSQFEMTDAEMQNLVGNLRTLRAWFYIRLLDMFRNVPISDKFPSDDLLPKQATPQETFNFIEKELTELIPILNAKQGAAGNGPKQGLWTKAGAAALLVRLYLNAELWIGQNRYADCASIAQKIIDGEYGSYGIAARWDAPFDWNNENCEELIYAFTSSFGYSHHVYGNDMFWWGAPFKAAPYFGFTDWGDMNPRFALQPGLDLNGAEYNFANGKPVRKFMKYPDDVRLNKYRNLGNSSRSGMFLYGALDYQASDGTTQYSRADNGKYMLYLRDQVGWYEDTDTASISPKPSGGAPVMISDMDHADQSSGWCMIKYPIYRSDDAGKMEADYALIRLPEIYYSLAECKFRQGDKAAAARLLNQVRSRYYPEGSPSLYKEDGSQITEQELLDEWGREFLGEGLRRTVLCRFGVYTGPWWDKQQEPDKHTMILPFHRNILSANPNLVQNPGYPDGREN